MQLSRMVTAHTALRLSRRVSWWQRGRIGEASWFGSFTAESAAPAAARAAFTREAFEELLGAGKLGEARRLAQAGARDDAPYARAALASFYYFGVAERPPLQPRRAARDAQLAEELLQRPVDRGEPYAQLLLGCILRERASEALASARRDGQIGSQTAVATDASGRTLVYDSETVRAREDIAAIVRREQRQRRENGGQQEEEEEEAGAESGSNGDSSADQADVGALVLSLQRSAFHWLNKAAAAGERDANTALGLCYLAGEGCEADARRAETFFLEAARRGHADAHFNLGMLYHSGIDGAGGKQRPRAPNKQKAHQHFKEAASLGDASAQFYLGHVYLVGDLAIKHDITTALRFLQQAAAREHAGAHYYLARIFCGDFIQDMYDGPVRADLRRFRHHIEAAARAAHPDALRYLAEAHYKGIHGVDRDYPRALSLFERAADLDDATADGGAADALCSAAAMRYHGLGAPKDASRAFEMYQLAAERGSVMALRNLAAMYREGDGVERDEKMASHVMRVHHEMLREQQQQQQQREEEERET